MRSGGWLIEASSTRQEIPVARVLKTVRASRLPYALATHAPLLQALDFHGRRTQMAAGREAREIKSLSARSTHEAISLIKKFRHGLVDEKKDVFLAGFKSMNR